MQPNYKLGSSGKQIRIFGKQIRMIEWFHARDQTSGNMLHYVLFYC